MSFDLELRNKAGRALTLDPTTNVSSLPLNSAGPDLSVFQSQATQVTIRAILDNTTHLAILAPDVIVEEGGSDTMVITDHPVEQTTGAFISDHAYRMPAELNLSYGWSPASQQNTGKSPRFLNDIYAQALSLQGKATLVQVNTGKRVYNNMLIQAVALTTDRFTDNALMLRITLREIMTAQYKTVSVSLDPTTQLYPDRTLDVTGMGQQQLQPAPNFNYSDPTMQGFNPVG